MNIGNSSLYNPITFYCCESFCVRGHQAFLRAFTTAMLNQAKKDIGIRNALNPSQILNLHFGAFLLQLTIAGILASLLDCANDIF